MLLERGKVSFLNVDIWFVVTKCKFIVKNSSFEMLVVFSSIFVADTKITFVYNFVAPSLQTHHMDSTLKRRGNDRFHVVSTWNPRGVFVGFKDTINPY